MITKAVKWALRLPQRRRDTRFLQDAIRRVDAVLVSYPKSGRTWLRYALSCYFAKVAALDLVPDLATTFRVLPNLDRDPVRGLPAFAYGGNPMLPLIAVSHREYDRGLFADRPVVFLLRDPRDVVVSSYFHATRHKHRYHGTLKSFIRDHNQGLADLLRYLNGWAAGLAGHRHHVVSYEAMSDDPARAIRGILVFLGVPCDEAALTAAVEASRFDAMRQTEQQSGIPGHNYDRADSESLRMRKGKAGGFRDYLDPADIALIEDWCQSDLSSAARDLVRRTGMPLDQDSAAGKRGDYQPAPAFSQIGAVP